jgi:signal transduction histidine kinase/CheY-like chemotaxis protein
LESEEHLGFEWVHPDDRLQLKNAYEVSAETGVGIDIRVRVISDIDHSVRWARVMGQPHPARMGAVAWNVLVIDVTREEEALETARQAKNLADEANAGKSRFLAAASHDLRQPIQAMEFLVATLRARTQGSATDSSEGVYSDLERCVDTLRASVEGLLDISRLEAGVVIPRETDVPLEEMFARLEAVFGSQCAEKNLRFTLESKGLAVRSDANLLFSLLSNLVANAVRYTTVGGVAIVARLNGAKLEIDVSDTGPGIPAKDRVRVFEPFVRLKRGDNAGLGLGLSIVDRLARLLGHGLKLESNARRGTRFTLIATPATLGPSVAVPNQSTIHQLRNRRILIIEDTASVASALASLLKTWGCKVKQGLGQSAIKTAQTFQPEIIISDLNISDAADGVTILNTIRDLGLTQARGLILTGETRRLEWDRIKEAGYPVLFKPVRAGQLRATLESMAKK